ncbi:MAG: nucleotidyl transferase AbiEii/AbiGii toxin family protein [Gammaproteobacteria bacterium]
MKIIDESVLPDKTKALFAILLDSPELQNFILVGGTALALQIKHRISLDFDFACYTVKLPIEIIDEFINRLRFENFAVHDLTDITSVSQFKINTGNNLRDFARDYSIDGIKLTFFVHGKTTQQRDFYSHCETIQNHDKQFKILGIDGLKVAKILLLADRVRSRDLFDLMILIKNHSFTIDKLNLFIRTLGHIDDPEHYRAVLTGLIPLDTNDEGLKPVNIDFDIKQIYQFFDELYAQHDIKKTSEFYSEQFKPKS